MGRELRALGITVDYAPVCDLATHPDNPSLGIRAFGDHPARVGELAAAMVRGLQSEGVAAAAKHFPGKGDAVVDPHYELPDARPRPRAARGGRVGAVPCRGGSRCADGDGGALRPSGVHLEPRPALLAVHRGGRRPAQEERRIRRCGDHRCAQHARPRPGTGHGGRCDRRPWSRCRPSAVCRRGGATGVAALRSRPGASPQTAPSRGFGAFRRPRARPPSVAGRFRAASGGRGRVRGTSHLGGRGGTAGHNAGARPRIAPSPIVQRGDRSGRHAAADRSHASRHVEHGASLAGSIAAPTSPAASWRC